MKAIQLDLSHALFFAEKQYADLGDCARQAITTLEERSGAGNDFLGWLDLPEHTSAELIDRINATAGRLREKCDYVVCIGIGGSYLGAKAVNSALADNFEYYYAPNPGNPKIGRASCRERVF